MKDLSASIRIAVAFQWLLVLSCGSGLQAQPLPGEQRGASRVEVSRKGALWTVTGKKQVVTLNPADLALELRAGSALWRMRPSTSGDLVVRPGGRELALRLADAAISTVLPYDTGFSKGVKIALSGWRTTPSTSKESELGLSLYLTLALEGKDEELVFSVAADERSALVRRLDWPAPLDSRDFDHTVLSNIRGVLLPRDWPTPYHPIRASNPDGSLKADDVSEV